jgi:hypothetical protein
MAKLDNAHSIQGGIDRMKKLLKCIIITMPTDSIPDKTVKTRRLPIHFKKYGEGSSPSTATK